MLFGLKFQCCGLFTSVKFVRQLCVGKPTCSEVGVVHSSSCGSPNVIWQAAAVLGKVCITPAAA